MPAERIAMRQVRDVLRLNPGQSQHRCPQHRAGGLIEKPLQPAIEFRWIDKLIAADEITSVAAVPSSWTETPASPDTLRACCAAGGEEPQAMCRGEAEVSRAT